jgi:hypothetical protein
MLVASGVVLGKKDVWVPVYSVQEFGQAGQVRFCFGGN